MEPALSAGTHITIFFLYYILRIFSHCLNLRFNADFTYMVYVQMLHNFDVTWRTRVGDTVGFGDTDVSINSAVFNVTVLLKYFYCTRRKTILLIFYIILNSKLKHAMLMQIVIIRFDLPTHPIFICNEKRLLLYFFFYFIQLLLYTE